jgi:hypothetical protein
MSDHIVLSLVSTIMCAPTMLALIRVSDLSMSPLAYEKLLNTQKTTARLAIVVFFICASVIANARSSDAITFDVTLAAATQTAAQRIAACGDNETEALETTALGIANTSSQRIGCLVSRLASSCVDEIDRILIPQSNVEIRRRLDKSRGLAVAPRDLLNGTGLQHANVIRRSSLGVAPSGDRGLIL